MPKFSELDEMAIAARYWAIKAVGSVEALASEVGISKPTLMRIANRFPPARSGDGVDMEGSSLAEEA